MVFRNNAKRDRDIDEDVNHRIKTRRMKWHQASSAPYDKIPKKLKGKFYRTANRLAMLHGAEC